LRKGGTRGWMATLGSGSEGEQDQRGSWRAFRWEGNAKEKRVKTRASEAGKNIPIGDEEEGFVKRNKKKEMSGAGYKNAWVGGGGKSENSTFPRVMKPLNPKVDLY